ncbi:uncharacterized protein LOC110979195 isoform X2 [Acanthaster planci]|uniref:Uncharacterized protein LOC110979195 isoform X2 n=1 Tax=Acanthaster planci TaxID=133434 RepID=A0A8B7YDN4_ACAPL|nr:uncharacterized protein LOC110979195 isoform X2 [Acanthaster planci]
MNNSTVTIATTIEVENQTTHAMVTAMENCSEGSQIVWSSLGMCLKSPLQYVAFCFAIVSLCFWLISHLFLLRARHLQGNASRRQFFTLVHICSANLCNVVGARLSGQLGTQVLIAGYFVGADLVFFIHYVFTRCITKPQQSDGIPYSEWKSPDRARGKQNGDRTRIMCLLLAWLPAMIYMPLASSPWQPRRMEKFGPGRKLMMVSESSLDNFGFTLGVFAIVIYGLAKVPVVKDGFRQSDYLLRHAHVNNFAILANICYVLSIIIYDQGLDFLLNALPWLLICTVCTLFDVIVLYLIARQQRQRIREEAAQRWEEGRDPSVRAYEDGREDGSELNDDGDEGWVPKQEPRLAAIHEDEEDESDESLILREPHTPLLLFKKQPPRTQANLNHSGRGAGRYDDMQGEIDVERTGQRSPIQALPPPPQHPRGGRRQKEVSKTIDNFGEDLEWDLSDMSKTYKEEDEIDEEEDEEDEEVIWDEDLIRREVEAELRRREGQGSGMMDPQGDNLSDISVRSLEFEDIPVDEDLEEGIQDEWFES